MSAATEGRRYWDEARETRDPTERAAAARERLRAQLDYCYERVPFYRRLWDAHGVRPDQVRTWDDFTKRIPVVTKKMLVDDQAEHPPFGSYLGVEPEEILRIHGSTGTSGTPTLYGVGKADWERAAEVFAMTQWAMGVRPNQIVQFAFPFSLFFGGWGVLYGAERIGAAAFPIGFADTKRHVELMYRLGSAVLEATPSYLLHMAEVAREMGFDPARSPLRHAIVGGEPGGSIPPTRSRLIETWGLETVCDSGSTSEMFPFCTNTECTEMTGPHLWLDEVWTEGVDPEDPSRPLPEGERGTIVYTHLWRTSQPMIRFAPGDAAIIDSSPCACGRTYPRLPLGVLGRVDDMLVVRGVNVYPSAIERALREIDELGLEFRIFVERRDEMDEITVGVELDKDFAASSERPEREPNVLERAEELVRDHCQIRVPVELLEPNTYERTTLKAKRVIDRRPDLV
jgi:phenylacetate-CoA ligase